MSGDQLLAIDVGTQSVRAIVFDPTGTVYEVADFPGLLKKALEAAAAVSNPRRHGSSPTLNPTVSSHRV